MYFSNMREKGYSNIIDRKGIEIDPRLLQTSVIDIIR